MNFHPKSAKMQVGKMQIILLTLCLIGIFIYAGLFSCGQPVNADPIAKVADFSPSGECDLYTNITVKFTCDMVSEDSLDMALFDPPLVFDPAIQGIARWTGKSTLQFYPDRKLLPATQYEVGVKSDKTFLDGRRIEEKRKFRFHTPPLKVQNVNYYAVYDPDLAGHIRLNINLNFNYNIEINELRDKLSIVGLQNADMSRLSYEIMSSFGDFENETDDQVRERYANSIYIITDPLNVKEEEQEFLLKVRKGLECYSCGSPLSRDFEEVIRIEPRKRLYVRELSSSYYGRQPVIQIPFSNRISDENAKGFISIRPEIDFAIESRYNNLVLSGGFIPGETYTVIIAAGMPAADGSILENEFSSRITIPDSPPLVNFLSQGTYLSKEGARLLEIETVNIDKLAVEVEQFFANNLVYALASAMRGRYDYRSPDLDVLGRTFFETTKELDGELNKPLKTTIDMGGIIGDTAKGVFRISARNKERRWDNDARLVLLTDIGIMARLSDDYLMVWANSLSGLSPLKDAEVMLFSKNNQILLKGKTNSKGIAVFEKIRDKIEGFQPFLITVSHKNDLSYLLFDDCLLPTSDFDTKGRPYLTSGYEAFLYLDRGIFRPGDTTHISSIVRGPGGAVPPEFPYIITINDPKGREFRSVRLNTGGSAFHDLDLEIPEFAGTGSYTVIAHIGEDLEIGRTEFQVEEFMPDRIKVTVTTPQKIYKTGEVIQAKVCGEFLFGPPAGRHKTSGHISVENHEFAPSGWSTYKFSDDGREFSGLEVDLPDVVLDDSGFHTFTYEIPTKFTPPSALKALISASVSEQGGHAVSSYNEVIIHPYSRYVGLKLDFEGYAKPGEPAKASLIALDHKGKNVDIDSVDIYFYRMVYHTVLKKDRSGYYRYVSESTPIPVDSSQVSLASEGAKVSFVPPQYGRYRIVAHDKKGGHASSILFYASGWGYAPWSMENPDRIDIDLDKSEYNPGENAKIQIRAPFGGRLLVTVEKEQVLEFLTYDMGDNTAEITIPVKRDYFPNAYITATIIKKAKDMDQLSAARAFGVAPLKLNIKSKSLTIDIAAPKIIKPKTALKLDITVGSPGEAEITVAAVDAGILQLTDSHAPDPLEFFYGKKKLHLKPYDIYSFVYPEVERAQSHLSPAGGKMFEQIRKRHLNPIKTRRVKPVSLWSGIVKTNENGKAIVEFDIPEFNGKLVAMVAAVQNDMFGSSSQEITVRDKIIIQESFPRFISLNDVFEGFITLFNNTGNHARISVDLEVEGPAEIISPPMQTIALPDNAEGEVIFKIRANIKPGNVKFKINASDGREVSQLSFELPNRPAMPLTTKFGSGSVTVDNPAKFKFPQNWLESTDQYLIQTSSLNAVAFTENIDFLVKYPYGCLEQTTSRLFPLLYFNDLARFIQPELLGSGGPDYFIQEGIIKLAGMIRPDGSFSFWPGRDRVNQWASIYASHFLIEARKEGFQVSNDLYNKVIDNLKDIARGKKKSGVDVPEKVYAAYALAKCGKLEKKAVNYLKEVYTKDLPAFARFQLAGILALSGDVDGALAILPEEIHPATIELETGGRFNSGVRTNAIMLDVLTEIQPISPSAASLAKSLMEDARVGRWYTTQENAYALMALGKYLRQQAEPNFDGLVEIEGDSAYPITTEDFKLTADNLGGKEVRISIDGKGACYYYWQSSGIPREPPPEEFARGIRLNRIYLNSQGEPLDPDSIFLGMQVICRITAEALDNPLENVVINDLLPAGFEIENPRLKTTPLLSWLPQSTADIDYQDIRDDRLLIFTDLHPSKKFEYYYSLRAIAAGEFKIPPIAAECMYNPLIAGASSAGVLTITRSED